LKTFSFLFFISFIAGISLVICNCSPRDRQGDPATLHPYAQTTRLTVKGVTCHSCKEAIELALKAEAGIIDATVFLIPTVDNVEVAYDSRKITIEKIIDIINNTGKEVVAP
jgi:copper chaperone CopZ